MDLLGILYEGRATEQAGFELRQRQEVHSFQSVQTDRQALPTGGKAAGMWK